MLFRSTCRALLDSKNCFRVRVNWLEPWKSLLEPWKPSLECRADGLEGQDSDFARMASEGTWWNLDNTGCNLENMAWKLEIASLAPRNNYDCYYIFCIYLNSIILINNSKLVFLECNRRKYIIFSLHLFDHKRISCICSDVRILRIFLNAYIDETIKNISPNYFPNNFRTIFEQFPEICF